MFVAIDNENNIIDIDDAIYRKNSSYYCPICKSLVRIRNGGVRVPHFSHINTNNCDTFTSDMSEWHREWQKKFPKKNREIVLEWKQNLCSFDLFDKGDKHRADILCYGYVIEIQNSPISSEEFFLRNSFYTFLGYKVVWLFNLIQEFATGRISYCADKPNGTLYSWKNARKTFITYDNIDSDIILLFQFRDIKKDIPDQEQCYIERVVWAISSNDSDNDTDFKRFITTYTPSNYTNMMKLISTKKL